MKVVTAERSTAVQSSHLKQPPAICVDSEVLASVMVRNLTAQRQSTTRLLSQARKERNVARADIPTKAKVNLLLFMKRSRLRMFSGGC
jgi:hypothetical protein